jgi:ribosome-associated protein
VWQNLLQVRFYSISDERAFTCPKQLTRRNKKNLNSTDMARLAAGAALDKKALDPLALDLRGISSVAEYFVILTGTSDRHVQSVAENVMEAFKSIGVKTLGEEGLNEGKWVLLDYGEIVVHVFLEPVREYYDIERLWIDAPRLDLEAAVEETKPH